MKRLNIKECENFISFFLSKIEKEGLMHILHEYQGLNKNNVCVAIGSLYQNLTESLSFQDSIKGMKIKFPLCIEEIFIKAIENSALDYALTDMEKIFKSNYSEYELFDCMSRLLDEYNDNLKTEIICEGCFLNEFEKVLKRAEIEKAYEIIFEQDDEKYFIQRYIGIKSVKYIEPCHSKTYKTFYVRLEELSKNGNCLSLLNKNFSVQKLKENKYCFSSENISIIMIFK